MIFWPHVGNICVKKLAVYEVTKDKPLKNYLWYKTASTFIITTGEDVWN